MSRVTRRSPVPRPARLPAAAVGALVATGLSLSACGSSSSATDTSAAVPAGDARTVQVSLTSGGCTADPAGITAGALKFAIKNVNASAGTEVELVTTGGKILGEKENLTPGLSGSFSLRLAAGSYQIYCPNTKKERSPFTVTAAAGASAGATATPSAAASAASAATAAYRQYVIGEVALLVTQTQQFTAAVTAGDVAKAKALYAPARYHYETIEPVAESFGDLDPDIDARENDVADLAAWTGFHRIEKALYQQGSLAGMAPYAAGLQQNVLKLQKLVADESYQPAQLANGAVELLDEVAKSKVTGEEERYSHTDLWDFAANVEGSRTAYDLLLPVLTARDASLAATITGRFDALQTQLREYRSADGYVDYAGVPSDQRRALAQSVDALAEPLSQVAALVS
jgi:iron uptake system component EfeO